MKQTLLAISLALAASSVSLAQAGVLKIGATPVPFAEILEHIQPALEKRGVELEITEFNDYVQPNYAVADGELDLNLFQHKPYLDMFIKEHGSDLVDVGAVLIAPMGVYSHKIQNLSEVKEGDSVGIPNDPTNGGRALLLLAKAGLIKVSDPNNANITVLDIAENPKNLDIHELEAAQLPRSLEDLDVAVINTNYAMPAGLNPVKDSLFLESSDSPYVNIVVANSKSAKNPDIKILLEELSSEDAANFIKVKYEGALVPVGGSKK